jgi:hypothetical protein
MILSGYGKEFKAVDIFYSKKNSKFNLFITRLDGSEEAKNPYFLVFNWGKELVKDKLKLSLTRATVFDGENRPKLSLSNLYKILIGKNPWDKYKSYEANNLFGISLIYYINNKLTLYNEISAEDWHKEGAFYPRWTGFLHGVEYYPIKKLKIFIEHARNNIEWYHHRLYGTYTKGGVLIGHPMDRDADSLVFGGSYDLSEGVNLSFFINKEKKPLSQSNKVYKTEEKFLQLSLYNYKFLIYMDNEKDFKLINMTFNLWYNLL